MEIWERVKSKPEKASSQMEIFGKIGKGAKPKIQKITPQHIKVIQKTKSAKDSVSKKIKELSTRLAELKKRQNPDYPNDYLNRKIVETLSKLRVYGTTKKMLDRLDIPNLDIVSLTNQINSNVQKLFIREKNNSTQKELLNNLRETTKKITSENTEALYRRELFLDFANGIRRLHVTLYETHVSRGTLISEFNKVMENILGK